MSVAKRSARTAVQRNRIRRRIRAAVLPLLEDLPPTDMVIVWSDPKEPDTNTLHRALEEVFARYRQHRSA